MAKKLAFDRWLFSTVAALAGFGLVMVYSASAAQAAGRAFNPFLVKQGIAGLLGFALMLLAMHVDYRKLREPLLVRSLVVGSLLLLILVLLGPELNATRRWIFLAGVSFQPSELAKLALVAYLAYQIEKKQDRINSTEMLIPAAAITFLLGGLVVLEPDLGTAILLGGTAVTLLFLAGLSWRWVAGLAGVAAPALYLLVMMVPYRRARLLTFLDPERDPLGAGFQVLQSLIAVGSGGILGLGPGESLQKLYFLPYPFSDFIYAIVAEELGLIGAVAVLALFGVLAWRGVLAGLRAPDLFGRYLGWGITTVLVLQALINISVVIAIFPTKGMPLPFISYGGSSLVMALLLSGVLLNISQHA